MMMKLLLLCLATLMGLATSGAALAQQSMPYNGPHMWEGGWHGWFLGPFIMMGFFAMMVVIVVYLVRRMGGSG